MGNSTMGSNRGGTRNKNNMLKNENRMGITGIKINVNDNFPILIINEDIGELETIHMIKEGNTIHMSLELYSALIKDIKNVSW